MNMCQKHWDAMRAAVEARGMTHLVAKSGEEAMKRAVEELEGTAKVETWDPLMAAYWAISNRVLGRVGLAALAPDFCPLCAVQESYDWWAKNEKEQPENALDAQGWIDSCMDAMLKFAREKGLMPGVQ